MESLKQRLLDHYNDLAGDFDQEEINNVINILDEYNDELWNLSNWDQALLLRMIHNDDELYSEVDELSYTEFLWDDEDVFSDY